MPVQIHWHEGLFLQPHHLQRMQRSTLEQIAQATNVAFKFPYGLIDLAYSEDDLHAFRVRIRKLKAVMPSGQFIDFSETPDTNTELPPLDIKQAFIKNSELMIYLGLPLWAPNRGNTLRGEAGSNSKLLYKIGLENFRDENNGENPQDVQIRRLNARLMIEQDDPTDMDRIPLFKIRRSAGAQAGLPEVDQNFVGPCLLLSGSQQLTKLFRDMAQAVETSRKTALQRCILANINLKGQITSIRSNDFENLMRLQILNRFSARLNSLSSALAQNAHLTPFEVYLHWRELLAELLSLYPDRDGAQAARSYDHDNPYAAFKELDEHIRPLLKETIEVKYKKIDFELKDGYRRAQISAEDLQRGREFFLGIVTNADKHQLADFVIKPHLFKVLNGTPPGQPAPATPGVPLRANEYSPELPSEPGVNYFKIEKEKAPPIWQMIELRKEMMVVPGITPEKLDLTQAQYRLYLTLP